MCFWLLLIVLLILAIGSAPAWPYSRGWGYYPSSGVGVLLILLLLLWWFSWLPWWGSYTYWR
jgi:hypothetical protein